MYFPLITVRIIWAVAQITIRLLAGKDLINKFVSYAFESLVIQNVCEPDQTFCPIGLQLKWPPLKGMMPLFVPKRMVIPCILKAIRPVFVKMTGNTVAPPRNII